MTDTDQKREDDVLRRMLATKPKPHKPLKYEQLDRSGAEQARPVKAAPAK